MFQQEFLTQHPGYTAYRPRGRRDISDAFHGLFAVLTWCRDHGFEQLLIDTRGLENLPAMSMSDRLDLGEGAAKIAAGKVRVALIGAESVLHPERIGGVVASNRGLKLGIFTQEVEALEWLVGPNAVRPVLETERLRLRWLVPDDATFIQELVNQPSWLANIGERNVRSPEDAVGYITNGPRTSYAKHGFGLWCAVRKEDEVPVGICGLLQRDYLDHPDIGFAYLERFQGQGYGTEGARATLAYAREALGIPQVMATVVPTNAGSIRILEKLGMGSMGLMRAPGDDKEVFLYGTAP